VLATLALGCAACGPGPAAPERRALRIAVAPEVASLEPSALAHGGQAVLCNVFEGLVAFDAQMRVVPALALRWESPDDATWRFYLRPGVRLHDGRVLTAQDVVASLERSRQAGARGAGNLAVVASVSTPSPGVVEIRTSRPEPMLLNSLVPTFVASPGGAPGTLGPVGTGPYRVVAFDGKQSLELASFAGYWRGSAAEPRLRFVFERDPQRRLKLLGDGAVDVALRLPEDAQAPAGGGFRLFSRAAPGVRLLGLRVAAPPFSDLRLRQAIDLALDRETITRDLLAGRARPLGQLLPQGFFGHVPELRPRIRDLAAARRLVAEATHGRGVAVTLAHGKGRQPEAERIAAQLQQAGLRVSLESREVSEISAALARGDFPMILWSLISYTGDANDVFGNVLHSPDPAHGWGEQNSFGYRSAALDRLVERAAAAQAMGARLELFQAAMRQAMQDLVLLPLWEVPWVTGVGDDVDFTPGADGWFWGAGARRRD
jgi:peptide/nickel transport system substrate-binding protein